MPGPKSATTAWPTRPTSCRRLLSGVQPSPGRAGWPPEDHHHGGQLLSQRKPLPGAAAAEILQHARDRVHRRDGAGDPRWAWRAAASMTWRAPWASRPGWRTRWTRSSIPTPPARSRRRCSRPSRRWCTATIWRFPRPTSTAISSASASTSAAWTARPPHGLHRHGPGALDTRDAGGLRQRYRAGHCPSRGAGRRACLGVRSRRGLA